MARQHITYSISGYRYAPESFQAFKRICGGARVQIPLSSDQRSAVGYLYLTKGQKAAVDYVKRSERQREHRHQSYVTYGFLTQEDPNSYLYAPQLYCRVDAPPAEKVEVLRTLRQTLLKTGGRLETSTKCELDGLYRPINVVKNYVTADYSGPVSIHLTAA